MIVVFCVQLAAARCEPPHGKFFLGYPWYLYKDLGENLRFAYYDIVALDNSLRAEIQAPMHLRTMFQMELLALGKEIAGLVNPRSHFCNHFCISFPS